jgi:hypothetical protein
MKRNGMTDGLTVLAEGRRFQFARGDFFENETGAVKMKQGRWSCLYRSLPSAIFIDLFLFDLILNNK